MSKYGHIIALNAILAVLAISIIASAYPKFIELVNVMWGCFAMTVLNCVILLMITIDHEIKG
jgi:hypothetical protein